MNICERMVLFSFFMCMDIQKNLANFKKSVDREIAVYMDKIIAESRKKDFLITQSLKYVKKMILSGGKRIRPAFMYYGYLAAGGKEKDKILRSSISIELIHTFLLIHDDIMDKDDKRHGIDTMGFRYKKIAEKIFPKSDSRHFGNSIAIIVGDMVGALGNQVIFNSGFEEKLVFRALTKLQEIISLTCIGQAKDVYIGYQGSANEEEILKMYEHKTAKYTIEGPLYLGAMLANADKKLLDVLSGYAIPLGVAFQIQDDILGIFGSEEKIGKPVGSDIEEGKQTILVARARKNGNKIQQKRLNELMGKSGITRKEIEEFRDIISNTGALDYAREMAQNLILESKKELAKAEINSEAMDFLEGVADYMIKREI